MGTRDASGVLTIYYYDASGNMFSLERNGQRYYISTDQLGSPKVVSDIGGALVKVVDYDAWGVKQIDGNPAFDLPIGFAGGVSDGATSLVRFGFRDYEPGTGRWTARDPILFKGGQGNLYGYVHNSPINFVDVNGLVNWGQVAFGVAQGVDATFTGGIGFAATYGTFVLTGNPVLTGIVGMEMLPVWYFAGQEYMHAFKNIYEGFKDDKKFKNGGCRR